MSVEVRTVTRPGWSPLRYQGCVGVDVKGLIRLDNLSIALLRFGRDATIHEHPADFDVDVICLEGEGFASVAKKVVSLKADETVRWPAGVPHRLWTEGRKMVTLMIEHRRPNQANEQ